MARPIAANHNEKRLRLLGEATRLFADAGYDRTSMAEVAAACGVSKALLYHYYASKDVLLHDILKSHLDGLLGVVLAAEEAGAGESDLRRLEMLAEAVLESYRDADAEHKLQLNDMDKLPSGQVLELKSIERRIVAVFAGRIAALHPDLTAGGPRHVLLKPVTMSLFGMLNWHYLWHRPGGALDRAAYARLAVSLVANGVGPVAAPTPG